MKLNLKRFDEFVKSKGNETPAALWKNPGSFDPANLKKDKNQWFMNAAGAAGDELSKGEGSDSSDDADVIGK